MQTAPSSLAPSASSLTHPLLLRSHLLLLLCRQAQPVCRPAGLLHRGGGQAGVDVQQGAPPGMCTLQSTPSMSGRCAARLLSGACAHATGTRNPWMLTLQTITCSRATNTHSGNCPPH